MRRQKTVCRRQRSRLLAAARLGAATARRGHRRDFADDLGMTRRPEPHRPGHALPFGNAPMRNTRRNVEHVSRFEQVFLVHRETGLLLLHLKLGISSKLLIYMALELHVGNQTQRFTQQETCAAVKPCGMNDSTSRYLVSLSVAFPAAPAAPPTADATSAVEDEMAYRKRPEGSDRRVRVRGRRRLGAVSYFCASRFLSKNQHMFKAKERPSRVIWSSGTPTGR